MDKKHFYKYITVSEADRKWGIYVTGVGYTDVSQQIEYPLTDHPVHHYFHWSIGRRLFDYQIMYITKGEGIFESEASGSCNVKAGDIFVLFPDVWHRFCPNRNTGWNEYWIEFNGKLINHFIEERFLDPQNPVLTIGLDGELIDNFIQMFNLVKEEKLDLQYHASGLIFQILGQIFALKKFNSIEKNNLDNQIRMAKLIIHEKMDITISPEKLADELGVGYSLFRKEFKKRTGFSPVQYQLQLRINKAKNLLSTTNLMIKQIALQLGFDSNNYFSRLFKQKTGMTPAEYKLRNRR
ncbi:MAG: AraC family transcriptional regulator [Prolixibacteraceae bacterium]|jgi:AraC-like DNA-binding protein|nr:AraC family transcriptional regulator [Prolixibacteraceae bacterium]